MTEVETTWKKVILSDKWSVSLSTNLQVFSVENDGQVCPYGVNCWNRVTFVEYRCSVPGKHSYGKVKLRDIRSFTYSYINQGFWSYLACS